MTPATIATPIEVMTRHQMVRSIDRGKQAVERLVGIRRVQECSDVGGGGVADVEAIRRGAGEERDMPPSKSRIGQRTSPAYMLTARMEP